MTLGKAITKIILVLLDGKVTPNELPVLIESSEIVLNWFISNFSKIQDMIQKSRSNNP